MILAKQVQRFTWNFVIVNRHGLVFDQIPMIALKSFKQDIT